MSHDHPGSVPVSAEPQSTVSPDPRRWKVLAIMVLSLVVVVAGNTSLNVALPTLVREVGATNTQMQWMVDSYALVFAGLLLPAGALGDRFGRKGALQLGLVIFAVAAYLSTLATNPDHLIATRALGGLGAAFIMPATLSILTAVFPPHERSKAIAVWAGFAGAGGALGNVVSGFLLEHFWWGSVFFVNLPVVLGALILGSILVPTSRDRHATPLDPGGSLLSTVGLAAVLFAIIEGPSRGWTDTWTVAGFAVGLVALAAFVVWERRIEHPMLPMDLFRNPRFSVGSGVIFLVFLAMFGLFFTSTQYLQFVKGFTPLQAGLAVLPSAVTMVIITPRSDGLVKRFGRRNVMGLGLGLVALGLGSFTLLGPDSPYLAFAACLVVMAVGMATTMAPATAAIMSSVPLDKAGVGSAVNDTTREVGGALGIALLGSILNSSYRSNVTDAVVGNDAIPSDLAGLAQQSVGAALGVAEQMGGAAGAALQRAAEVAFTNAMGLSSLIGAVIVAVASGLVWWFMPRTDPGFDQPEQREPEQREPEQREPEQRGPAPVADPASA